MSFWSSSGSSLIILAPTRSCNCPASSLTVRNVGEDRINHPLFINSPPWGKLNWGYYAKHPSKEVLNFCEWVSVMKDQEGLTGTDLITAFIRRRVLPLQQRCHRIVKMTRL